MLIRLPSARRSRESTSGRGPTMSRRTVFKALGLSGLTAAGLSRPDAAEASTGGAPDDPMGLLVDTTRCVGCHTCEMVCAETNGHPEPDLSDSALASPRTTSESQWTVVNRHDTDKGEVFVKRQCMHCVVPACSSACLTKAMYKTPEGPVIWRSSKCMGCRYCMISCPYDVPKFEYHSANPKISKCRLCWERTSQGQLPACVENCPAEALKFGRRSELLAEARRRIEADTDTYHPEIYGEREVGGTSVLYLASVPFDQIGLPTHLGTTPYPYFTREFLYNVPVVLTLLPPLLLAVHHATGKSEEAAEDGGSHDAA